MNGVLLGSDAMRFGSRRGPLSRTLPLPRQGSFHSDLEGTHGKWKARSIIEQLGRNSILIYSTLLRSVILY